MTAGVTLAPARARWSLYLDLIRWNRPAGWMLLLWPTLSALWLAAGGFPGLHLVAVFVLGTILMRSAGCCINDVADREFDRHVKRTAQRPVTSGALTVQDALGLGAVLAFAAFLLVLSTNPATVLWSIPALVVTLLYPYAKRHVSMPQAVLGVAFSFGIPMAFAAVNGGPAGTVFSASAWAALSLHSVWASVPPLAWLLLAGNLFWVLAYDTEYAMVDRDDDLKIGMKTSAITLGRFDVAAIMAFYVVYLSIWVLALVPRSPNALFYIAIAIAAAQVVWHWTLIRSRTREGCFLAFRQNHWVGFAVFAGVALGLGAR